MWENGTALEDGNSITPLTVGELEPPIWKTGEVYNIFKNYKSGTDIVYYMQWETENWSK